MSLVKIGIIGCGAVFHLMHFKVIRKLRDKFKITVVYDPDKNTYKNNSLLINKASVNYDSFIKNTNVDAIFVLTPISSHLKYTLGSLKNNKHVFLEKPAALNVNEIKKMIAEAAKPLKVSALGGQYMLSNKKSGKLRAFDEKVSLKGDSNDHLMCLIEYRNGVKADLLISYVSAHTRESRWVIQLEDAKIITLFESYLNGINKFKWGTCPSCIYLFKDNKKYSVPWKIPMSYPPSEQNLVFYDEYKNDPLHPGSTRQLIEFHKSITKNTAPACSLQAALEDAKVIEAINRSVKSNKVVYV